VFSVLAAAASYSLLLCGAGRPVGASLLDSWCSLCWQLLLLVLDKVRKNVFIIFGLEGGAGIMLLFKKGQRSG
jgi:hypothetical protein